MYLIQYFVCDHIKCQGNSSDVFVHKSKNLILNNLGWSVKSYEQIEVLCIHMFSWVCDTTLLNFMQSKNL